MERFEIVLDDKSFGELQLFSEDIKVGKMDVSIVDNKLTVYHTEVNPEHDGKGFAKLLLNKLVSYAREHNLKIVPLCPYVHAQFKRHPNDYADIWYNHNS